ncbi:MAG: AMP-binding protein, partial [Dactylosporangium sp.]|nr:AMP-binding protein [Dactylosporangium sp.]NNJ60502.1 AMP-binding protein [Dactylosporangium sp.]
GHTGAADPPGAAGLAWIGFTSGSAGTPRPIGRTGASWLRSFPLVSELTGISAGQRVLVGGSLASSLFLFGALHALWAGAHVVIPARWEPARLPATDVAHCVPAMLDDLAEAPRPPRLVVCGGAALPDRVLAKAAARGIAVREYYGATELSFVAWRDPGGPLMPFPGVEVSLRAGEIWARSPYLSAGYANPAVTGPLRWDDEGFATVGDLGALGPHGALAVLGRADGTILTGGSPVLPQDVESVLAAVPGVREVVVTGTPHPQFGAVVTAVIEPADGAVVRLADLRAASRARLAGPQRPRHWYVMRPLPRTASGKPARGAIRAALESGALAARRLV